MKQTPKNIYEMTRIAGEAAQIASSTSFIKDIANEDLSYGEISAEAVREIIEEADRVSKILRSLKDRASDLLDSMRDKTA
jgi:hypothetical protein